MQFNEFVGIYVLVLKAYFLSGVFYVFGVLKHILKAFMFLYSNLQTFLWGWILL